MKKRVYISEARGAQAAQTRLSILQAAKKLFQAKGFEQVTIAQIAHEAEVSMPTIYALFKSKRGVLQSLIDEVLSPDQFAAIVAESMNETSPEKCLKATAKLARQIYDAERGLMDLLRGASLLSNEFRELEEERERRRYARQEEYVKRLMGFLPQEVTFQKARDIVWTLSGRDLYRMLVVEKGWTSDEYEQWLTQLLTKSLLG